MGLDRRGAVDQPKPLAQPEKGMRPVAGAKSFEIAKHEVVRAYKRVKANGGAAGADGVSLEQFERDVRNNLYRIWNQMSSGSYFAAPVKRVEIPKSDGKTRALGIPTVADRVAQMVVKQRLEPLVARYEDELKILLLPRDPNDDKNVILEIRAGAGGDDDLRQVDGILGEVELRLVGLEESGDVLVGDGDLDAFRDVHQDRMRITEREVELLALEVGLEADALDF